MTPGTILIAAGSKAAKPPVVGTLCLPRVFRVLDFELVDRLVALFPFAICFLVKKNFLAWIFIFYPS